MGKRIYYYRTSEWNSYMLKYEVKPVQIYGYKIKKIKEDVFMCKINKNYCIIDRKSGLQISNGRTKEVAINEYFNQLDFYRFLITTQDYENKCNYFESMIGGENGE